jgi:cephalosporin hydroxylase
MFKTLQNEAEHARFVEILREQHVRSYLEIGSKFGGSLWKAAKAMPVGSRIVSVDMPSGTKVWPESKASLEACIKRLRDDGYDASVIWGDSTDPNIIDRVGVLGPFDCVFLDGNHTLPFVKKDWANYGPMGRLVAFHDIGWVQRAGKFPIDVPEFWNSIKDQYRHEEIKLEARDNGIGVLWRA